jgi:hypothetical protein
LIPTGFLEIQKFENLLGLLIDLIVGHAAETAGELQAFESGEITRTSSALPARNGGRLRFLFRSLSGFFGSFNRRAIRPSTGTASSVMSKPFPSSWAQAAPISSQRDFFSPLASYSRM